MRFTRLDEWLGWQERLHPKGIDLGLERVRAVWRRLRPAGLGCPAVLIGGTNGKGSSVAFLDAILRAAGYRTCCYTSPHLLRYNERLRLADGTLVGDDALCCAFERVDRARREITLSYFEFGTLAAFDLIAEQPAELAILEVGLGGRLDAVNIVEPIAALVTNVGLDHQDYLGHERDAIGREKAGIYRPRRVAVCADPQPPAGLLEQASALAADLRLSGRDFGFTRGDRDWSWHGRAKRFERLPSPGLEGAHQYANAAGVLALLEGLDDRFPVDADAVAAGVRDAQIAGRLQRIDVDGVPVVLDVAHNPEGAGVLAAALAASPVAGPTVALFSAYADKEVAGMVAALEPLVERWHLVPIDGPRGQRGEQIAARLAAAGRSVATRCHADAAAALAAALAEVVPAGRVVVYGSFITVSRALFALQRRGCSL